MRSFVLGFLLVAALLFAPSAKAESQLFAEWHGTWWAAQAIGRTNDGRTVIHYEGWGKEWDEAVDASRLARSSEDGTTVVAWGGSWWPASIVGKTQNGALRVHYEGWGSEWDETVDASRVRRLRGVRQER